MKFGLRLFIFVAFAIMFDLAAMKPSDVTIKCINNLDSNIIVTIDGVLGFKTAFSMAKKNGHTSNPDKRKSLMLSQPSSLIPKPSKDYVPFANKQRTSPYENVPNNDGKESSYEDIPEVTAKNLRHAYENIPDVKPLEKKEHTPETTPVSSTCNDILPEKKIALPFNAFPIKITLYDDTQNALANIQISPDEHKAVPTEIIFFKLQRSEKNNLKQKLTIQLNYDNGNGKSTKTVTKHIMYDKDGNLPAILVKM